jgi:soluble lytic murein transglycosylase-like protein
MKVQTSHTKRHRRARRLSCALLLLLLAAGPAADGQQVRPPALDYDALVASASARYRLDPHIFRALVKQESGFQPCVTSAKGAKGLTQLMPATAARFGVKNGCDPVENVEGGAKYLRWLLDYFGGDYTLALAGYNAGEGAVLKYGRRVPPYSETMNYVSHIARTAMLERGSTASAVVPVISPASLAPQAIPMAARLKPETASTYFWE